MRLLGAQQIWPERLHLNRSVISAFSMDEERKFVLFEIAKVQSISETY